MTITTAGTVSEADLSQHKLKRTARITGLFYLGLAVTGALGFGLVRSRIFVAGDPAGTLANLSGHASLARLGIALELGIVLTQALAAVWFYRLFRGVDAFAAGSLAAFGLINAVMILSSAAMLAAAVDVAGDPSLAAAGDATATVQLLYVISGHIWGVAAIFFGLWLVPMGWLVIRSGWLPRLLGWILIGGGVGYILSAFVAYLIPSGNTVAGLMAIPATVGELWIVGYLIFIGVRSRSDVDRS